MSSIRPCGGGSPRVQLTAPISPAVRFAPCAPVGIAVKCGWLANNPHAEAR